MNRTSAIALFLLIFISHPTVLTATRVETLKLIFGQLFSIPVGNDVDVETLPNWMEYNGTSVYGIPQLDKVKQNNEYPNTKIRIADDVWLNIEYDFHDPNPCEYDDTLFFEVYKDKAYDDYPIKNLSEIIQDFATIMDVKVPNFRVFRADYLKIWRRENNEVLKQLGEKPIRDDQLVIVWKLGCGSFDDDDDNYNIVTVVSDNQFNFRVIQGVVNDIPPEVRPVTPPSTLTELERTTRQVDNPPMRVLPLGEYQCVKGKICSLPVPNGIFIDDLDSDLKYSVHPINHDERFLESEEGGAKIKGISLKSGQFDFRLDARDRSNQVASVPFIVKIDDEKDEAYRYKFILDHEYGKFNAIHRFNFLAKLAEVLSLDVEKLRMNAVAKGAHRQTVVEWNILQEDDVCNIRELKKILQSIANKNNDAKMPFVKKMGETYHVRKIKLEMTDRCSNGSQEESTEKTKDKKPQTTHVPMVEASNENDYFQKILLPFIFIVIVLVLLIVIVVYCCMFKKPRTKKQNKPLEYVTKGQPVVFPNELGHDDDIVSVSVPMLVKDERPPLQPLLDGTTIHENPLYKAPSAGRTSFSTENSNFNTAGTPRAMGTPNQRLPPPYVEP